MKKIAKMAVTIVVLVAAFSLAQDEKKGLQLGPRLTFGSFSTPSMVINIEQPELHGYYLERPTKKVDGGLSFGGGLAVKIPIMSFIDIAPEVIFLYRSVLHYDGLVSIEGKVPKQEVDISEFAISIPILALITLPESVASVPDAAKGFFLEVGPQIDIPFAAKRKETWTGSIPSYERDFEERATVDISLVVGLGYNITKNIAVDVRYVMGLTNFADKKKADELATKNGWHWAAEFKSAEQYFLGASYYF